MRFKLLNVFQAAGGRNIAAVHKAMYINFLYIFPLGQFQYGVKMLNMAVDAAVRKQTHHMQPASLGFNLFHKILKGSLLIKLPFHYALSY